MMLATGTACQGCNGTLGTAASRPLRLLDLTFHEDCAPQCVACGRRLGDGGESRWRYSVRAVGSYRGARSEPAVYWCPTCWHGVGEPGGLGAPGSWSVVGGTARA